MAAPPSPESVLAVLDTLLALDRPYRIREVGDRLGVRLAPAASSSVFFTIAEGSLAWGPLATLEVRESQREGPSGMVLATLRGEAVTEKDVARRTGLSGGTLIVPSPEAPPDVPRYVEHSRPWGVVRIGYDPDRWYLRSAILDAIPARSTNRDDRKSLDDWDPFDTR